MDDIEVEIINHGERSGRDWSGEWLRYVSSRNTKQALSDYADYVRELERRASQVVERSMTRAEAEKLINDYNQAYCALGRGTWPWP